MARIERTWRPEWRSPWRRADWSMARRRSKSLRAAAEDLTGEISTLNTLEPAVLLQKWKALFGTDPSPLLARIFLVRAIAYRLQEQRYGGIKPSVQRLLDRVCEGRADVDRKRIPDKRVSAGTVLIREWGGVSHRVTVLDRGVVYRGRRYNRCPKWPRDHRHALVRTALLRPQAPGEEESHG